MATLIPALSTCKTRMISRDQKAAGAGARPRSLSRTPFAMDRLKQRSAGLVYRCGNSHTEPM